MSAKRQAPDSPGGPGPRPHAAAISRTIRRWLTTLTVFTIGSWVVLGALIIQHDTSKAARSIPDRDPAPPLSPPVVEPVEADSGPWGRLEYSPIAISPPVELITEVARVDAAPVTWHFPNTDPRELAALFEQIGLAAPLREKLAAMAEIDMSLPGMSIHPPRQFVLDLSPESRAALYTALSEYDQNADHKTLFRYSGSSPDQWFQGSAVLPETRELVDPLIYRRGNLMFFADLRVIEDSLTSPAERSRLLKTLWRHATFLAHLKVSRKSNVETLVNYWGRGGREQEVRPLLESLAQSEEDQAINVTHLLPPFARRRLYTFPARSDPDLALARDCHWSTLNFFNEEPDDVFCEEAEVSRAIHHDYYRIHGNLQLGDVLMVVDSQKIAIHSAVYIAGDVMFHRCGPRSSEPWVLARLGDLGDFYPRHGKLDIRYYRRKNL